MAWKLNPFLRNRTNLVGPTGWHSNISVYSASVKLEFRKSSRCTVASTQPSSIAADSTRSCSKPSVRAAPLHRIMELAKVYSSPSADAYQDCALFRLTPAVLGVHIERFCRSIYSHLLCPGDNEPGDAPPGRCINGNVRGANTTTCDFVSGDCRVEVKTSSLAFKKRGQTWGFRWAGIKLSEFDRLILVGYTPQQVIFWEWDKTTFFSKVGKSTDVVGGQICISGKSNNLSWQNALRDIERKCLWSVLHSQDVSTVPLPGASPVDVVYRHHPLSQLKPVARGNRYAHFCRDMYSIRLFPGAPKPDDAPQGTCINGFRRAHQNSTCDFHLEVYELKSNQHGCLGIEP